MRIILFLLELFYKEEKWNIYSMVFINVVINLLQTNVISYTSSNIISSIQNNTKDLVYHYLNVFVFVSTIYIFLSNVYKYFQNKVLTKLRQWLKVELLRIVLVINNENMRNINFSRLVSPITRISSTIFLVFTDIISTLLPNLTFLFIINLYFTYINVLLGSFFFVGNILLFSYIYYYWDKMIQANRRYEAKVNAVDAGLIEIFNNIDKILYRGQSKTEIDIFKKGSDETIDTAFLFYSITNFTNTVLNIILYLIIFLCLFYIIDLYYKKEISLNIVITFITILLLYRDRMTITMQQVPEFIDFLGRTESVIKHFNNMEYEYTDIVKNEEYLIKPDIPFHIVRFENVTYKYVTNDNIVNNYVLQEFNLTMDLNNKTIGIVGVSGKGKSTLMKLLLKIYNTYTGRITIDGYDIRDIDTDYIRKNITYINQNSKLFDRTVIKNILYGCEETEHCNRKLEEILKYEKIQTLFKNVDIHNKTAGSLGSNLSGGQMMIVNVISGLVNPSKVLILDEPTNALDHELKHELITILHKFKEYKQAIIIITHDGDCYPLFDEIIEL